MKRLLFSTLLVAALLLAAVPAVGAKSDKGMIGINVVLNTDVSDAVLADLGTHGKVRDIVPEIRAVTMQAKSSELEAIQALPYVAAANPDAVRNGAPVDTVPVEDFTDGLSTWDLDAINVTDPLTGDPVTNRTVSYTGDGVYVAVLDTGLVDDWPQYFPQERIATEYGICFGGGGGDVGFVSQQPDKWQRDQNSHGTHVTSTILGYSFFGTAINGVAPLATVIPVKVLNQSGMGWSSAIAEGIMYVAGLKEGPLADHPVVINMSLGGSELDDMEKTAIDYAIGKGVIVVAAAGNAGSEGMHYPGAYPPVISAAASGWFDLGTRGWQGDVDDPTDPADFYIASFSSIALEGQDLDVAAPGRSVVGAYQANAGQITYYYASGTSMASPHVAGVVALMLEKDPGLTAAEAEVILEDTAVHMEAGTCTDTGRGYDSCDASGAGLVIADAALTGTP